ncbi:class E basic helix-loop-helix protein 22 [Astyanax mexicanus]|uniref:class E basic helix-loop-helix protein 22 n=1 Tax=Astyanax mexicanus TaxID=7994 RepID=UPI0020CAADB9|nr:class E basic helix-loop-helix protein 22 [Astyanax mexicanus]
METGGKKWPNAQQHQGSQFSLPAPHSEGPGTGGLHRGHWEETVLHSDRGDHTGHPAADPPDPCRFRGAPATRRRGASERARALRVNINARERRRMHDLNEALDELRAAMPYRAGPTAKKLSKIATLLLAKNHILLQARALQQMSGMVGQLKFGHSVNNNNNNNINTAAARGGGGLSYQPEFMTEIIIR